MPRRPPIYTKYVGAKVTPVLYEHFKQKCREKGKTTAAVIRYLIEAWLMEEE